MKNTVENTGTRCRILVVDDEEDVRLFLERELLHVGYEVDAAANAEAAIVEMEQRRVDIVITDIRMPGMDGIQFTEWIKRESPETDVILITGYASIDTAARAVRLDAADYLTKPFGEIELVTSSVNRTIEKRKQKWLTQETTVLAEIGRVIGLSLDLAEVFEQFAGEVGKLIQLDGIAVNGVDLENGTRTNENSKGLGMEETKSGKEVSLAGTFTEGIVDATPALRFHPKDSKELELRYPAAVPIFESGVRSFLGVPLVSQGQIIGTMELYSTGIRAYSDRDVELAKRVARQIAGAVANAQLHVERQKAIARDNELRLQFLNVLCHELKTSLTPVLSSSGLLKEVYANKSGEIESRLLNNILLGVETLKARLDDLLDIAAFQAGTLTLTLKSFDPREMMEELYESIHSEADRKRQNVILDILEPLPSLISDRERLKQVLWNLVLNAMKFNPVAGEVTLRAQAEGKFLVFEVQDCGKGISADERERLFQPYYRVEHDRQRFHGLGLGLTLSRQIVEGLGGEIWVESGEDRGSTFIFTVPLPSSANDS